MHRVIYFDISLFMFSRRLSLTLIVNALLFQSAYAQDEVGAQFWNLSIVRGKIDHSKKWDYYFEVQPRIDLQNRNDSRILIRPAAIYNLNENESLWIGALELVDIDFKGLEFRTWQQYQRIDPLDRVIFLNRARLEQRFLNGETDIGLRLRLMIRTQVPMGEESKWSLVFFDEVFLGLNENKSQPNQGLDQNRAFVGMRFDGPRNSFFEFGYMNQYTKTRTNHIPFLTIGKIINKKKK
ncbi:MAG: DUF2490 domain-containing protein [Xanthomonadaceae bacterium]|nr:DUF2490 domain-containing protein [Xanthomonadaceae bacterium]